MHQTLKVATSFADEQTKINRDLLKVMALINDGFAKNAEDARDLIDDVTGGLVEIDTFFEAWAKDRKATKKDIEEIRKKFKEIDEIDTEIIKGSHDYIDLLKERNQLILNEGNLSSKLLQNHVEILKIVKASKSGYSQLSGITGEIEDGIRKIVAQKVDMSRLFDDTFSSLESSQNMIAKMRSDIAGMVQNVSGNYFEVDLHFNPVTDELDSEMKQVLKNIQDEKTARLDALSEYFSKNKQLQQNLLRSMAAQDSKVAVKFDVDTGDIETANGVLKQGSKEYQQILSKLDKFAEKKNLISQLSSQFNEINELIGLGSQITEVQTQRLSELLKPIGIATEMLTREVQLKIAGLQADELQLQTQKQVLQNSTKYLGHLKSAESVVQRIGQGFDYVNALLPSGISEFIGLSRVSSDLMTAHRKGVEGFASSLQNGVSHAEALKGYFAGFKQPLLAALNPVTLLVAGFAILINFIGGLTDKYKQLTQEMGISLNQSKELSKVQLDTLTSQKNQFATLKDIEQVQTTMIGQSGKVFDLTNKDAKELSMQLVEIGKYFGYGNETAAQLHKTFERLGADDKLSLALQKNLGYMSEMAGISPQIVSKDLIENSDIVATYFAGFPDKAAKAAIQVRRMGMSLQQAGSIAQKMLDLDGFMTDMYELQAMTNGGIDFSEAFDKGLMGDIEGMTESIMKNIGSTQRLNQLDYLTRTKVAKTLGMSVDELSKSVYLQEQMLKFPKQEQELLKANLSRMGDISQLSQEEIRNRLSQLQSTDRLAIAWDKIKGVLVSALIPVAETFSDLIDAISPILDIVIMGFKGLAAVVKLIAPLIKGFLMPFKWLGDLLSKITSTTDSWFDSMRMGQGSISLIEKSLTGIGSVLGLIFAPKLIFDFFGLIKSGFKIIPSLGSVFGFLGKSTKQTFADVGSNITTTMINVGETIKLSMSNVSNTIRELFSTAKLQLSDISNTAVDVSSTVASTSSKNSKKIVQDAVRTGKQIDSVAKKTATVGVFNPGGAKVFGEVVTKSLTAMAIQSASSFLFMRKEGERQSGELADSMQSMFGLALSGLAPILMQGLQYGLEKTFSKRLEKTIEGSFETPIKKVKGSFSTLRSMFTKFTLAPNIEGTFDQMSKKVSKSQPTLQEIQKTVTTKTISENKTVADKPILNSGKRIGTGLDSVAKVLSQSWKGIKTVLTDLVKFVSESAKTLSSGIGTAIKNILKGIGDGLSSFKTSAVKGAAAMLVLSGALWVTSKAVQNFASVKWEDLAKAGVALGGLVAASLLLGSASGQMILGAVAIAILGASLIPAAYALNEFNKVEWSSLGKAAAALVGLGVVGGILGTMAPMMLLGSISIAALGASIIPLAIGMQMFNKVDWESLAKAGSALLGFGLIAAGFAATAPLILTGSLVIAAASASIFLFSGSILSLGFAIKSLDFKPLKGMFEVLKDLTTLPVSNLLGLSFGITSLGASILSFNALTSIGSIVSNIFGNSFVKDLEKLASMADPLYILAESIGMVVQGLNQLGKIDVSNLGKIEQVALDTKVQKQIKPVVENYNVPRDSTNVKISPIQTQVAKVLPPSKVAVAQNERLNPKQIAQSQAFLNQGSAKGNGDDSYNVDVISDLRSLELKFDKLIYLTELLVKKELSVNMDSVKVNAKLKARNNN